MKLGKEWKRRGKNPVDFWRPAKARRNQDANRVPGTWNGTQTVFPTQIPLSSKLLGNHSPERAQGRLEVRALFNKADCKRRYFSKGKKKGGYKAQKSTGRKLENARTEDAHSKDLESLCENAL